MKITFDAKNTEQLAIIRNMGSKNKTTSLEAQEAFAAAILPVARLVVMNASTTAGIYEDLPFVQDQSASIPLDTYYDEAAGLFECWSQNTAGGLPTNFTHDVAELKVQTYVLESAISMMKKYARESRLDVVSKAINRLLNEVQIKQDLNGWVVILKALSTASTRGYSHVFRSLTADVLGLNDFNALLTRGKRIGSSYANGTPDPRAARGVTDLFMSPEMMEQIRALSYNPVNTRSGAVASTGATSLAAPDSMREAIYNNAGATEIYGITLHELNELGIGFAYNNVFTQFAGSFTKADGTGSAAWTPSAEELIIGVDKVRGGIYRPVETNSDTGSDFALEVDDQFPTRSEKLGWWGKVQEGRIIVDNRSLTGLVV